MLALALSHGRSPIRTGRRKEKCGKDAVYTLQTRSIAVRLNSGVKRIFKCVSRDDYRTQLKIIDRFIIEWLTDEKATREQILENSKVEAEFLYGFTAINQGWVRDRVIISALHNDVHEIALIGDEYLVWSMHEVSRDPEYLDPPGAKQIADLCLFANQLSGNQLPHAHLAAVFIFEQLGDSVKVGQLLAEYPVLFHHWKDVDGQPAVGLKLYTLLLKSEMKKML